MAGKVTRMRCTACGVEGVECPADASPADELICPACDARLEVGPLREAHAERLSQDLIQSIEDAMRRAGNRGGRR